MWLGESVPPEGVRSAVDVKLAVGRLGSKKPWELFLL
jgi:hypothetical protein